MITCSLFFWLLIINATFEIKYYARTIIFYRYKMARIVLLFGGNVCNWVKLCFFYRIYSFYQNNYVTKITRHLASRRATCDVGQ